VTQDEMRDQLAENTRKNQEQQLRHATQVAEFEMKSRMLQIAIDVAMSMLNEPLIKFRRELMR